MVKPKSSNSESSPEADSSSSSVYRGVRKRKWGKYVSEIRLPNSRERIWLGSYDTPEKAARAFDAALFCLRGKSAKFNFPNNPPEIQGGQSLTPLQIQSVAAKFAHHHHHHQIINIDQPKPKPKTDIVRYMSRSPSDISSSEYSSSSTSTLSSTVASTTDDELVPMDWSFLDLLSTVPESVNTISINYEPTHDFGDFTRLDDFPIDFLQPPPPSPEAAASADYVQDNGYNEVIFPYYHHHQQQQQESFLWNF